MSAAEFDLRTYENHLGGFAFHRSETRRARLKRPVDCEHEFIDATEPYRYSVWKLRTAGRRDGVEQQAVCEFCARADQPS